MRQLFEYHQASSFRHAKRSRTTLKHITSVCSSPSPLGGLRSPLLSCVADATSQQVHDKKAPFSTWAVQTITFSLFVQLILCRLCILRFSFLFSIFLSVVHKDNGMKNGGLFQVSLSTYKFFFGELVYCEVTDCSLHVWIILILRTAGASEILTSQSGFFFLLLREEALSIDACTRVDILKTFESLPPF